ncbi:MAG: fluoride efflux transporter CrcB [Bacteroidia bacterium]|nr:fluoride efflux transporter CrcB [Bacteroidia bacterium]
MNKLLLVFIGGGLGSVLRYLIGSLLQKNMPGVLPWPTLLANVLAAAVLGFFTALFLLKPGQYEQQRLLIGVGFCGGLSTFSSFTLEGFELLRSGNPGMALAYMVISIMACLAAFWAAWMLQK